jgi:serine/threonine-protein kinase RsbW
MEEDSRSVPETMERLLESTLESVDKAEELITALAQRVGFSEEDVMKIGLAVRESMVNAVVHGNRYSGHKAVRLAVTFDGARLTVRISDQGEGFDVDHLPDPLAEDNLLRTSGRGIFLIRSFMDEVRIRRLETGGIEVTLVKYSLSKQN